MHHSNAIPSVVDTTYLSAPHAMDIPLSSDALDLALYPDPQTNLLAVGLISGKVQAVDVSAFLEQQQQQKGKGKASGSSKRRKVDKGAGSDGSGEEDDEPSGKLYEKKWSTRFSKKSCRGVEFDHGQWW